VENDHANGRTGLLNRALKLYCFSKYSRARLVIRESQSDNPDTQQFCGDCGTNLTLSKDIKVTETLETPKEELTTGSTFAGRYQIIEELGKGGMGKVYKVHDTEIKEKVALNS